MQNLLESRFLIGVVKDDVAQGGADTGWDIVTLTDWMAALWIQSGHAALLDKANIPNAANLAPAYQGVSFVPNRDYTLPWFSGFAIVAKNFWPHSAFGAPRGIA